MKLKSDSNVTEKPKRVFLADPYSVIRLAVAASLRRASDLTVCGQADNASEALRSIWRLKPDIVVTETFSQQDCKFIRTLRKRHPRLPILVFSSGYETWFAPRALEAGANGYLPKGVGAKRLLDGIRGTLGRRVVLSQNMRYRLLVKCLPDNWPRRGEVALVFCKGPVPACT
jgi:two-component system invasion response regulator UvrY